MYNRRVLPMQGSQTHFTSTQAYIPSALAFRRDSTPWSFSRVILLPIVLGLERPLLLTRHCQPLTRALILSIELFASAGITLFWARALSYIEVAALSH